MSDLIPNKLAGAAGPFPFAGELGPVARARLFAGSTIVDLEAGAPVLRRGDAVAGAYFVISGVLRIFYLTPEGREGTLYWVTPGQSCILALNCTFSRVLYPAWVEAGSEPTRVAVVPGPLYRELFEAEPAVQRFTFDALSSRLFELMCLLEQAASLRIEQRIAALVLRAACEAGEVRMSQDELARHLGTAREVVSRNMRQLAARGLVQLAPGVVTIRDRAGLQRMSEQQ